MKPEIRTRVLLVALIPALAVTLLLGFYFVQIRFRDLETSLNERGLAIVRQLAPAAEYGVFSGNREVLARLAASVSREADVAAVAILDDRGKILTQQGPVTMPPEHRSPASAPLQSKTDAGGILASSAPIVQSRVELEEIFGAPPARPQARVLGRVYVAISREALLAQRRRLILDTAVISLLILLGGVVLAVRMSRGVTRPVVRLTEAVQKIAGGDLDARVAPDSAGAIRTLEDGVNAMAASLKTAHTDLERRIAEKHAELERNYARLRELEHAQLLTAERERMMRDMHDGVGGQLVAALAVAENNVAEPAKISAMLRAALDDLRLMIDSLDPADEDLAAILGMLRGRMEPRLAGCGLRFRWQVDDVPPIPGLGPQMILQVLRILQEALCNCMKHARARTVSVKANRAVDPEGAPCVCVEVSDDGVGLPAEIRAGRGLGNMRRRARDIGARLEIAAARPGTAVRLWLPLAQRT